MSSEISIETAGRVTAVSPVTAARPDDGFRPWHFFVLASNLLATVGVILARRSSPEHLILKTSMVVSGKDHARQAGVDEVAERTVRVLKRTVPAAQPM